MRVPERGRLSQGKGAGFDSPGSSFLVVHMINWEVLIIRRLWVCLGGGGLGGVEVEITTQRNFRASGYAQGAARSSVWFV